MNRSTAILLAVVVLAYGVPLLRGYLHASRLSADEEALRVLLEREVRNARGSYVAAGTLNAYARRFRDERTLALALEMRDDPRPLIRLYIPMLLWDSFPDEAQTMPAISNYLLNPRENAHHRHIFLINNRDIARSPLGEEASALLRSQTGFFAESGYFFEDP